MSWRGAQRVLERNARATLIAPTSLRTLLPAFSLSHGSRLATPGLVEEWLRGIHS